MFRNPLYYLTILLATLVVGCGGQPPEAAVRETGLEQTRLQSPTKSPNDTYSYRYLRLENGLQALLVSDPDAQKAAAALSVHVGSGENPAGRGGLAHFLEHMLFLGTDKYPDAGEYGRYISQYGGSQNAYTDFERTNYFFDVNSSQLPGALNRFAQFFIAPRFDDEYVEREKNAVQAEYLQSLKSDGRRALDVLQQVMNPQHPYHQLAVGTLDTLADQPDSGVREELISFYRTYYSADRMALVVLGPQPLDRLEELVIQDFAAVPEKLDGVVQAEPQPAPIRVPMFEPENLPMLVKVEPLATRRQLQVSFPVGDYRTHYDVKPMAYVGNLVGHEGSGSLLSRLKADGLAEGLSAGSGLAWRGGSLFSVNIALTEKGVTEYGAVLDLLFAYIDMLRAEGAQAWLYEESAQLADLRFRFLQHGQAMNYVTSLAPALQNYQPEDVLYGPYMMSRFDPAMIDGVVAALTPENALVVLTAPGVQTDLVSPYYEVPYSVGNLGKSDVSRDASSEKNRVATDTAPSGFSLPEPNSFIPGDVSLVETSEEYTEKPVLLLEQPRQEIWFGQDDEFQVPKGGIYVNFRSPLVAAGPMETAEASMFVSLLKDELNELTYPALLAGLNFSFYAQPWGISMRISGYNDKQGVLLEKLLGSLGQPALDEQRFSDIRDRAVRGLQNRVTSRPSSQAMARLNEALLHKQWSDEAMISAYQGMEVGDVAAFVSRFWAGAEAEVLVYGNYNPETANKFSALLTRLVGDPLAQRDGATGNRVARIPTPADFLLPMEIRHDDSVVVWYLQGAGTDWHERAEAALTAQVMKSEFFRQLRTEQQLGYTASSFAFEKFDVPGLVMLIQSPVASATQVSAAMNTFIDELDDNLDEPTFNRHKEALVREVLEPDKNLWERAEYYWQSMAKGRYEFDGRKKMADALESITYQGWRDAFYRGYIKNPRSLKVVAPGKWSELPKAEREFENTAELKASLDYYEFP